MIETVAIIPARAGSQRLPAKNMRLLAGRPMLSYTLDAASACSGLDLVILSSDDQGALDLARRAGVRASLRPPALAGGEVRNAAVCIDLLDRLAEEGIRPRRLVLLQPTSPLRTTGDITGCLVRHDRGDVASVISVTLAEQIFPPSAGSAVLPLWRLDGDTIEMAGGTVGAACHPNGAIYVVETDRLRDGGVLAALPAAAWIMPANRSVDIDTLEDFTRAAALLQGGDMPGEPPPTT